MPCDTSEFPKVGLVLSSGNAEVAYENDVKSSRPRKVKGDFINYTYDFNKEFRFLAWRSAMRTSL